MRIQGPRHPRTVGRARCGDSGGRCLPFSCAEASMDGDPARGTSGGSVSGLRSTSSRGIADSRHDRQCQTTCPGLDCRHTRPLAAGSGTRGSSRLPAARPDCSDAAHGPGRTLACIRNHRHRYRLSPEAESLLTRRTPDTAALLGRSSCRYLPGTHSASCWSRLSTIC